MGRKIAVVTGTRADYGLLLGLMQAIREDSDLELQVIATGMHLSPEYGSTYKQIEKDGFRIDAKVEMLLSSDTPVGVTKSIGLATIGFADVWDQLKPDIAVVLGDRYEILAAAQAAAIANIPLAHIHGGETTEGAVDEAIRHAVTKMSHVHFVSAELHRQRVIQLGEHPDRVFTVGAPGIDLIRRWSLLDRESLEQSLHFQLADVNFLVTYHPVTLQHGQSEEAMKQLLAALDAFPHAHVIFTLPNSDTGNKVITAMIHDYAKERKNRVLAVKSLGPLKYWSAIQHVDVVIGNSSSGLIEVPYFRKPTVNIGDRQKGRLRGETVIDCDDSAAHIVRAIRQALSPEFKSVVDQAKLMFGEGNASSQMKQILKEISLEQILIKRFYDLKGDGA